MPPFPLYRQLDAMDCGPTCLRMVAQYYGRHYTAQTLREQTKISREGTSMFGLSEAAEAIGFRTVGVRITTEKLINEAALPAIIHWNHNHFIVLHSIQKREAFLSKDFLKRIWGARNTKYTGFEPVEIIDSVQSQDKENTNRKHNNSTTFHVADPARGLISYTQEEFEKHWLVRPSEDSFEGIVLLVEPTPYFYEEGGEKAISKVEGLLFLTNYLRQYRSLVIQLVIGMLASSGLQLLFPLLTQSVVDVGINSKNIPFIYIILLAQLALMLGRSAIEFIQSWILLHISVRLNISILSEFLSKLMRLPVSFFDVKLFGDIMQRIGDHKRIESFLTGQTLTAIFSLFNLLIFGIVLALYNQIIFIVALSTSALYSIWVLLFLNQRRKQDAKRFAISSRSQSQIVQLIQGMQDIKLAGSETLKRWEWEHTQAKLFKWSVKNLALSQYQTAGALFINEGKNIFITFLAAKAVVEGQLTLGGMMSVQYILGQFNAPIGQLLNFVQSWQDAQMSMERLNEVHQMADEEHIQPFSRKEWPPFRNIVLNNLSYTYPGADNEPILKQINLNIPYGKTTAIVGTSGSGKTTLLKLLLRFYEPQSGTIELQTSSSPRNSSTPNKYTSPGNDNIKLAHLSHSLWRQQCGVVMQDGFIFSDTIARNIAVSEESIDQNKLYYSSQIANIQNFIESLPLGYHTKIGAEGNGISQGQKQRILIARAVYKDPKLLLFDEATNSLDANNEAVILKNLGKFFKERTVVVVAHRLSTIKNADQIVVMEKGRIVECGTHGELVAFNGRYFELISNQLEISERK